MQQKKQTSLTICCLDRRNVKKIKKKQKRAAKVGEELERYMDQVRKSAHVFRNKKKFHKASSRRSNKVDYN